MAAELIPAPAPRLAHVLRLPPPQEATGVLEEARYALGDGELRGDLTLEAGAWLLRLPELRELQALLESRGLRLTRVHSDRPETLVAAAALGLVGEEPPDADGETPAAAGRDRPDENGGALRIHRGTLRSGDHLRCEGSVLLLGDVNPGARLSAAGHILIWGRLRGVAEAGSRGDTGARIVALQLRPLQLRIAGVVARGPEEPPPAGLAEQARLVDGEIRIDPADPVWPLDGRPGSPAEGP